MPFYNYHNCVSVGYLIDCFYKNVESVHNVLAWVIHRLDRCWIFLPFCCEQFVHGIQISANCSYYNRSDLVLVGHSCVCGNFVGIYCVFFSDCDGVLYLSCKHDHKVLKVVALSDLAIDMNDIDVTYFVYLD